MVSMVGLTTAGRLGADLRALSAADAAGQPPADARARAAGRRGSGSAGGGRRGKVYGWLASGIGGGKGAQVCAQALRRRQPNHGRQEYKSWREEKFKVRGR